LNEQEQLERIAALPTDKTLYFDMSYMRNGKWVYRVSWNKNHIVYLGRDTYGHVAKLAAKYPATRLYRMEQGRKRLQRRGAFVR
jgi:hypothetical protein